MFVEAFIIEYVSVHGKLRNIFCEALEVAVDARPYFHPPVLKGTVASVDVNNISISMEIHRSRAVGRPFGTKPEGMGQSLEHHVTSFSADGNYLSDLLGFNVEIFIGLDSQVRNDVVLGVLIVGIDRPGQETDVEMQDARLRLLTQDKLPNSDA